MFEKKKNTFTLRVVHEQIYIISHW